MIDILSIHFIKLIDSSTPGQTILETAELIILIIILLILFYHDRILVGLLTKIRYEESQNIQFIVACHKVRKQILEISSIICLMIYSLINQHPRPQIESNQPFKLKCDYSSFLIYFIHL